MSQPRDRRAARSGICRCECFTGCSRARCWARGSPTRSGRGAFGWHRWFGYACLVLVTFRIAVGLRRAALRALRGFSARAGVSPGAMRATGCRRAPWRTLGHNPLGGWMVLVLLALVAAEGVTGLFANDEIFNVGPLYGYVTDATSDRFSSWHRVLADALWYAIGAAPAGNCRVFRVAQGESARADDHRAQVAARGFPPTRASRARGYCWRWCWLPRARWGCTCSSRPRPNRR